jgi:ligand-binding sensor domain-containing protein
MSGWVKRRKSAGKSAGLRIIFCLLWFATGDVLWSQPLAEPDDWVVDSWQTEAGLPLNSVTCVLQTRDGYLWIGTPNGLARFDGVRFTTYRVADGVGLRSNRILCLFETADGVLWVGTDEGGLTSHQQGKFTTFTTQDGLS